MPEYEVTIRGLKVRATATTKEEAVDKAVAEFGGPSIRSGMLVRSEAIPVIRVDNIPVGTGSEAE